MRHITLFLLVSLTWFSQSDALAERPQDAPPNIVLFVADDLGYAELGCYGQKIIRTPRIDEMASQGIRFTNFYSGNAVCAPSRCCLMTGKHPGHAFVRGNANPKHDPEFAKQMGFEFPGQIPIPADEITLAELLQQRGYATGAFGKWGLGHFGTSGDPNTNGFDLFYGYNCQVHAHSHYPTFLWRNRVKEPQPGNTRSLTGETYSQDQFVSEACAFIKNNSDGPFFVFMPMVVPHLSIQVPEESLQPYLETIEEADYVHKGYLQHPHPRAGYAAMVTHMDAGIGQVIDQVESLGLTGDTLFLFTSDNGPTYDRLGGSDSDFFQSAGPLKGLKGQMDEGGIRIPLVASWQGHIAGPRQSDWIGAWWDFLPTLCEVAGQTPPAAIDGVSFLPTLLGDAQEQPEHEFLYWESPGYSGQQAVRLGEWKAIRKGLSKRPKRGEPIPSWQLYNLDSDIGETTDVAAEHPEVIARVESIAAREHTPSDQFPLRAID
ncbi:arylsulfatase [Allorhodopirellula heiligendammensis]|uniref:Arylsulfatase n=1 Tax=Allorhodopirellula heiligendammensis TaxID=2714739 RepID=A0A5C6BZA6_9BACT|nr:arylsulfatase [Allorhodopirellula heiligendammensis]TWU16264.1 Arylsulfatase [Allorhodopirellula heiligendammensis]